MSVQIIDSSGPTLATPTLIAPTPTAPSSTPEQEQEPCGCQGNRHAHATEHEEDKILGLKTDSWMKAFLVSGTILSILLIFRNLVNSGE